MTTGDTLQVSAYIKRSKTAKGGVLRVVVRYIDKTLGKNGKDKKAIVIAKGTSTGYELLQLAEPLILKGTVKSARAEILYTGKRGRFFVDDVSLILTKGTGSRNGLGWSDVPTALP